MTSRTEEGPSRPLAAPRPFLPHLRSRMTALGASDRKVAQVVLAQPGSVVFWSITELADAAGTAKSSVVRFCQALGLRGFHDLKLLLAQEVAAMGPHVGDVADEDTPTDVLGKVVEAGVRTLRDALATVGREPFEASVELIGDARGVLLVGVGTSAPLAQDAAYRLRTIGVRAEAPADAHVQHVAAKLLAPGDVCLAISHSGSTRETRIAVGAAREAGAARIAVTSFASSPLTELGDHVVLAGAREASHRLEAMTSRLAHVAVLDALLVAVALRDEERAQAALSRYADAIAEHRL